MDALVRAVRPRGAQAAFRRTDYAKRGHDPAANRTRSSPNKKRR